MSDFQNRVKKTTEAAIKGAEVGLSNAAEHLLQVSRTLVPHQDGDLERSGKTSVDGLKAAVSYDTTYAVDQHENVNIVHKNGRQSKFLESAMDSERDVIRELLAEGIKKRMGL